MEILTVKQQNNGYLLNGTIAVPIADGNKEYELIKQWLDKGNTPEPIFTEEEIHKQELEAKINEAKQYLSSTDYKMTIDYFATLTKEVQDELIAKRAEARDIVRQGVNNG